jgi:hypothetical protein
MLRSVGWASTDVSGLRIGSIYKSQAVQEDSRTLVGGTDT